MSKGNKIPSISLFSERFQFRGSPVRPVEHLGAVRAANFETQYDIA